MKKSDKYPMSGNDFERLLENWQAANRKRRAA